MEWLASVDTEVFEVKQKVCSWLKQMETKLYRDFLLTTSTHAQGNHDNNETLSSQHYLVDPKSKQMFHKEIPLAVIKPVSRDTRLIREPSLRRQMFTQRIQQQLQQCQDMDVRVGNYHVYNGAATTSSDEELNSCKTISEGVNRVGKVNVLGSSGWDGSSCESISDIKYISNAMINMVKRNSLSGFDEEHDFDCNDEFV